MSQMCLAVAPASAPLPPCAANWWLSRLMRFRWNIWGKERQNCYEIYCLNWNASEKEGILLITGGQIQTRTAQAAGPRGPCSVGGLRLHL